MAVPQPILLQPQTAPAAANSNIVYVRGPDNVLRPVDLGASVTALGAGVMDRRRTVMKVQATANFLEFL